MNKKYLALFIFIIFYMFPQTESSGASVVCNQIRNEIANQLGAKSAECGLSSEQKSEHEKAVNEGISSSIGAAATIGTATAGASLAGAGSLAGYAGMASAVSTLGLGSVPQQ